MDRRKANQIAWIPAMLKVLKCQEWPHPLPAPLSPKEARKLLY
jgi:hypothetical protein